MNKTKTEMVFEKENFINTNNVSVILEQLEDGDHLFFGIWELFMNYTGTFWIRRDMTQEEIEKERFEGWHQELCQTLEEALEKIGCLVQKQVSIFDAMDKHIQF